MIGDVGMVKIDGRPCFVKEVAEVNDEYCYDCFFTKPDKNGQMLCKEASKNITCSTNTRFVEITKEEFELFAKTEQISQMCEFCLDEYIFGKLNIPADKINYCPICGRKLK